jgi:1,4-dihydroxy-2-naphthoate octaprenyltransferase
MLRISKGDSEYGRRTLPVVLGLWGTRIIISLLILIITVCLIVVWYLFIRDVYTLLYIFFLLIIPLTVAWILVIRSSNRSVYGRVSTLIKLIMLAGLLYMVVVRFILSTGAYLDAF